MFVMFVFCFLMLPLAPFAQEPASSPPPAGTSMTKAQIAERVQAVQTTLEALPQATEGEDPDASYRSALQRLAGLLESYGQELTALEDIETQTGGIEERAKAAQDVLERLNETNVEGQTETGETPEAPTKEGLEQLRQEAKQYQESTQNLQKEIADIRQRQESLTTRLSEARDALAEAEKNLARFAAEEEKAPASDKEVFAVNTECARIESYLAQSAVKRIELQGELDAKLEPVLQQEIEIAEKEAAKIEAKIALYENALKDQMAQEQAALDRELAEKEKTAEKATTPEESFLANVEAGLAASRKNEAEVQTAIIEIGKDMGEQEKRLNAEKAELESLRALLANPDSEEMAKERIRQTMDILAMRRKALQQVKDGRAVPDLSGYRSRRFEIENLQFEFSEKQEGAVDDLVESLPEQEQAAFIAQAREALLQWRAALRDEKATLTEAILLAQKMQDIIWDRLNTLNEAERFVRSRALWIRDAQPIHQALLDRGVNELNTLTQVFNRTRTASTPAFFLGLVRQPKTILAVGLVIIVFPALLWLVKQKFKRLLLRQPASTEQEVIESIKRKLRDGALSLLNAIMLPAWLFAAVYAVSLLELPDDARIPLLRLLIRGAFCALAWSLITFFLREETMSPECDTPQCEGRRSLRRALRLVLLAYMACVLPAAFFSAPPAALEVLPRMLHLAFIAVTAIAAAWTMRTHSPLTQRANTRFDGALGRRAWSATAVLFPVLLAVTFFLNIAGFRYASSVIGENAILTLVVLALLALAHLGVQKLMPLAASIQVPLNAPFSSLKMIQQLRVLKRVLNTVLLVVALLLLFWVWGIDEQALGTLEEIQLYSLRGTGDQFEFVTAADLFWFVTYLAVMAWLLRYLPGIYEFAIFPRLKIDDGAKYAVLTISRYGIFIIGVILALSQIHLDLGRLGWLIAAIGVGLGFGLQEIISNFFSGIILLIERPIRIKDIVTIGDMTGEVRRINIRATTIRNFDYQEVVLPNKDLITRAVTNWTRGDTVNRLVIEIGAAYGSDVNLISQTLHDIAADDPNVLADPAPVVTFERHGDSALEFVLRVFLPSPSLRLETLDRLNKRINAAFQELNIEIPFPQRDIHIRSNDAGVDSVPSDPSSPS